MQQRASLAKGSNLPFIWGIKAWDWGTKEDAAVSKIDLMRWTVGRLQPGTAFVFDSLYGPRAVLKWLHEHNYYFLCSLNKAWYGISSSRYNPEWLALLSRLVDEDDTAVLETTCERLLSRVDDTGMAAADGVEEGEDEPALDIDGSEESDPDPTRAQQPAPSVAPLRPVADPAASVTPVAPSAAPQPPGSTPIPSIRRELHRVEEELAKCKEKPARSAIAVTDSIYLSMHWHRQR